MGMDGGPIGVAGGERRLDEAVNRLRRRRPDCSAATPTPPTLIAGGICACGGLGLGLALAPDLTMWLAYALTWCGFAALATVRLIAAGARGFVAPYPPPRAENGPVPLYTILCPLYREASQVTDLIAALRRLDYPRTHLQIVLVIEADDAETAAAIARTDTRGLALEVCIVAAGGPRTKPKALNYALAQATGDFVVVYDAEDRPDPAQLRAALGAFATQGERCGVVQAPLRVDNGAAGWITRQFAAEYEIQFGQILPLCAALGLAFPLGGTSNHFRRAALIEADGWDAFNVTEDADIGYRLARLGWTSAMIAPPTWEEAPIGFAAWLRQRTRWLKGHLQTLLVLARAPLALKLGDRLAMLALLGGGVAAAFLHGPLLLILIAAAALPSLSLDPADWALAAYGYASALCAGLAAAVAARDAQIARAALTMPLYWPLASIAALAALIELVVRPFYWAKTAHGLSARGPQPMERRCPHLR
jgi:glycosyltransferase XagB